MHKIHRKKQNEFSAMSFINIIKEFEKKRGIEQGQLNLDFSNLLISPLCFIYTYFLYLFHVCFVF